MTAGTGPRIAAKRFGQEKPLFLAVSMGAATVLMASDWDLPENTRGILADCGFTTPWQIMAHVAKRDYHLPAFPLLYVLDIIARLRAGVNLKEADTRTSLQKTRLPVLFFHGKEDDFVPVSMTEENYRACKGEKELHLVSGAGHAQSFGVDPQGCQEAIVRFLTGCLRRMKGLFRWEKRRDVELAEKNGEKTCFFSSEIVIANRLRT